jgi:hypothetical protein
MMYLFFQVLMTCQLLHLMLLIMLSFSTTVLQRPRLSKCKSICTGSSSR